MREALWDGVARGLVTSDGFQALRNLLSPARSVEASSLHARRSGLRRGASGAGVGAGRWALVARSAATQADRDALAEAAAEQLLVRWGVVFYDLYAHENLALPWRDIVWALRRLEARGSVRGGRFVAGFVGEQFALPEAIELLRSARRSPRDGTLIRISACDPLNLVGVILPGPRIPAVRTNTVAYRDGALAIESELAADDATCTVRSETASLARTHTTA